MQWFRICIWFVNAKKQVEQQERVSEKTCMRTEGCYFGFHAMHYRFQHMCMNGLGFCLYIRRLLINKLNPDNLKLSKLDFNGRFVKFFNKVIFLNAKPRSLLPHFPQKKGYIAKSRSLHSVVMQFSFHHHILFAAILNINHACRIPIRGADCTTLPNIVC